MDLRRSNRELWLAFAAIVVITILYLFLLILEGSVPRASGLVGHSLGILGFILMVMTETLYTYRKRSRSARLGRMSEWLQFHIFTGIVGPYLVLLHSSWKFNGLAGIVMLLTVLIVISGFVGRYLYTAIPRTADGVAMQAQALERQVAALESQLQDLRERAPLVGPLIEQAVALGAGRSGSVSLVLSRGFLGWRLNFLIRRARRNFSREDRALVKDLERLIRRRGELERQRRSLAAARRLLALWHAFHVPLGIALFTLAFVHIVASVYYVLLSR